MAQRRSLSRQQLRTGAAVELLALCQTMTEDGSISDQEVHALREWLAANRSSDLPAWTFLERIVTEILADGKVTAAESRELYKAVESVLPPDVRPIAVLRRREAEAEAKARALAEREKAREEQRATVERDWHVDSFDFMVAGVPFEGRPHLVKRYAREGDRAYLIRDRANQFSRNAVEVRLSNGAHIGYVPEDYAFRMAPLLDTGCLHTATVKRILASGRFPIPVVLAYIHRPDAQGVNLCRESEVPARVVWEGPTATRSGCLGALLLGIAAMGVLVLLGE